MRTRDTKQIRVELRLRLEIPTDADQLEAVRQFFTLARRHPAAWLCDRLKVTDVEVEDPWGFNLDMDGWQYGDFTDGDA